MLVEKPKLLVDEEIVRRNIDNMIKKARNSKVIFRPHFKTHQSKDIAEWFRDVGVKKITVSSITMAEYFAINNWLDITVAFPTNINEINKINDLAKKITLGLLVESKEVISFLNDHLTGEVNLWIKIDTGNHRTGIAWDNYSKIIELIQEINKSDKMTFTGLLTHAGHAYKASSKEEVKEIYFDTSKKLNFIKERIIAKGFKNCLLSVGDTPTCSIMPSFPEVDEIRPGNFVFYDVTQLQIGSCAIEDIGVAVACPVVAKHPDRKTIIIYGGAIHLSKEFLWWGKDKQEKNFGLVSFSDDDRWHETARNSYVSSVSQEHGVITTTKNIIQKAKIGDTVYILPIHSCLTTNLMKNIETTTRKKISSL